MKRFKYLTLAALVAFGACSEDEPPPPVDVPVTGTVSGVVTIEGVGQAGVSVALSSGSTATTDGSGAYSFANVPAGAYTVSISGFASDATFSSTSKAASITTAGQVAQVNFDGAYVRTSAILGSVAVAGVGGIAGVNVSISGASMQTDAAGQYSFSGLRAGDYTVSISGFDGSMYAFTSTSQAVTVGVGESEVVSFSGQLQTTARVFGEMFIDENVKNDVFDSTEDALMVAGVSIELEISPGNTMVVETDANGAFEFADLTPGTFKVTIDGGDADIPATVQFGGSSSVLVTVTVGATGVVNFPFDILQQTIDVYAFLGVDEDAPGVAPIEGWDIKMYDTDQHANAGGTTGLIGTETTDAGGLAQFVFLRADDVGPGGGVDNIVYAKYTATRPANHTPNGEQIIEIKYDPTQMTGMAPDTFDALHTEVVVGISGQEIDGDALEDWGALFRQNDTTAAVIGTGTFDADGMMYMTISGFVASGPDSIYARLQSAQAEANGHGFDVTPMADMGMVSGRYISYMWNGTVPASDTLMMGSFEVKYTDADINIRMHHEADDVLGWSAGDAFTGVGGFNGELLLRDKDGDFGNADGPVAFPGVANSGEITFLGHDTDSTYQVVALAVGPNREVIGQDTIEFTLDGGDQSQDIVVTEDEDNGYATFAFKFNNAKINGNVKAADGTGAEGMNVTIAPADGFLGTTWSGTLQTNAGGFFTTPDSLLDGSYTVTVADSAGVWTFEETLETAASGTEDNDDAHTGTRSLMGSPALADKGVANFRSIRLDREIAGAVINDRADADNVIDPLEALAGAQLELVNDDGDVVATATTGANGGYEFTELRAGA